MRSLLAAGVLVIAAGALGIGVASAEPRRDVPIESDPPGADVYLNSKDDGSVCKTPCTIKAPVGDSIVILEIENHTPLMESLSVPRRGKPPTARFKLVRAVGTVHVKGPEGATIRIGDVDRGKAPAKLEIDAGPHTITLTLNGRQVLQDLIEVQANEEVAIRGKDVALATAPAAGGDSDDIVIDDGDDDGGDAGGPAAGVSQRAPRPRTPRAGPLVAISGLFDVGFRTFTYQNVGMCPKCQIGREVGQVIAGPMLELWPGTLAGVRALRGLSLMARVQFPVNALPTSGPALSGTTTTFWQSLEISARHRWTLMDKGTVEVGAGFVRDQHQFNTNMEDDLEFVPSADYRSVRIGLRGSLLLGALEPYFSAENRIVLSGGDTFANRFRLGASTTGLRVTAGLSGRKGPIIARLEGSLIRYAWTFKSQTGDEFEAEGAVDSIKLISIVLGYAY